MKAMSYFESDNVSNLGLSCQPLNDPLISGEVILTRPIDQNAG